MKKIYVCVYCGHSEKQPFEVCANCGKDYTGSEWITGNPKPRRKELQAKLEAALQRIDSLIGENVAAADDLDASESGKSALQAEIDRQVTKTGLLESAIKMLKYENEEPQPDGNLRTPIGKVLAEKDAEIEQLKAQYNAEVDQYNAGYEAGESSGLDPFNDQPHYEPDHDVWRGGYRDASYDRLKAELAAKQAIIDEQRREIADLHDFQFEAETIAPDGSLRVLSRRELREENKHLTSELVSTVSELYEALATCTELAERGEEWVKLYVWGRR